MKSIIKNIFSAKSADKDTHQDTLTPQQAMNKLIDEIHENFYTEVDRLLAQAKIHRAAETDKQDIIDKAQRLSSLGFTNTLEVQKSNEELSRLRDIEEENKQNELLVQAIEHFSFKYPNYKFITEDSVKKICAKYNLVYGRVEHYTGTVPDKNLEHIENFKIDPADEAYTREIYVGSGFSLVLFRKYVVSSAAYNEHMLRSKGEHYGLTAFSTNSNETFEKCPMEIAAPVSDFNLKGMNIDNFNIQPDITILDPVVLQPVYFKHKKHYLIVTAWGQEASDELVVNQKMN